MLFDRLALSFQNEIVLSESSHTPFESILPPDGLLAETRGGRVRIGQDDPTLHDEVDGLTGVAEDLDGAGVVDALQGNVVC